MYKSFQDKRGIILLTLFCTVWIVIGGWPVACSQQTDDLVLPTLLPGDKRIEVREGWLEKRHEMLLPLMRKHGVGMWIVVNEEFHDDPLTEFVAPPRPYCGNRDLFVFIDGGDQAGLKKCAITGYTEENVERFFEVPEPGVRIKALQQWFEEYQPQTIALGIGGRRGMTRSLTHDTYNYLVEVMGPEAEKRIISAAPLIEEYLDTRIPEEFQHYTTLVHVTEILARRALSNEVITPGETTLGDVRRWLYRESAALGLRPWFQPDLRIQRQTAEPAVTERGFLPVGKEAAIIERGDVVHLDFGLIYMGLYSDWQKMMYVLREGEQDAPAGLRQALASTNALQDALARFSRPGKAVDQVVEETMAEMEAKEIVAMIYSHPLGNQGHALGTSINSRGRRRNPDAPARLLRGGSYLAMELNTSTPVPEWGGQKVTMMAEDPVYLADDGWRFFRPRQEELYLVK